MSRREIVGWVAWGVLAFVIAWAAARTVGTVIHADLPTLDAGLIATFAGVVGGVPVALLLGSLAAKADSRSAAADEQDRRIRVLRVIQTDLTETMDELVKRDRGEVIARSLRTDVWDVLAASDQLALINDPDLLNVLARAYHFVATTSDLERQVWRAYHDPAQWTGRVERGTGRDVSGRFRMSLAASVRDMDPHTKSALDVALTRLAVVLGDPSPLNVPLRADRAPTNVPSEEPSGQT